jgi:hypothetical protein
MSGQVAGQAEGVVVLAPDAQRQRLHAAFQQIASMRIERSTHVVDDVAHRIDALLRTGDDTGDDVAVAVQVFRRAVHDDVDADRCRTEVHRARERVVDDGDEPVGACEAHGRFQVQDVHHRVGDRFEVEDLGLGPQSGFPGRGAAAVHWGVRQAQVRHVVLEPAWAPPYSDSWARM